VVASLVGCGSPGSISEPTAYTQSAIQGGTLDTTHTFTVGIIQLTNQVALCSGVLLGPNLVATARHCVAQISSPEIDCATSSFGPVFPATDLHVTTAAQVTPKASFVGVSQIIVPSGAGQSSTCGNDIALMILDQNIELPQYVVPTINPPMTDHSVYSTSVTAIGYGLDSPTDEAGVSAGYRRIKENIPLFCVPNDQTIPDCLTIPGASRVLTASEFMSGDGSTCEGDSGSSAFDQGNFDLGKWVSFGLLSRGGVSQDGQTCIQPIYTRFDAWGPLLIEAATEAASAGGYNAPAWAGGTGISGAPEVDASASSNSPGMSGSSLDGSAQADGASNELAPRADAASSQSPGTARGAPEPLIDGTACPNDSACQSNNCVSTDDKTFVCAHACASGTICPAMFSCQNGFCFPAMPTSPTSATSPMSSASPASTSGPERSSSGCTFTATSPEPWRSTAFGALILFAAARTRRRGRLSS
jgi:secreted trypsin-like serine protease